MEPRQADGFSLELFALLRRAKFDESFADPSITQKNRFIKPEDPVFLEMLFFI